MAESNRERGSRLPDQTKEIEEKEKQNKAVKPGEKQDDFPVKEVERDEKGNEKKDKSIKDIPAGEEKTEEDDEK